MSLSRIVVRVYEYKISTIDRQKHQEEVETVNETRLFETSMYRFVILINIQNNPCCIISIVIRYKKYNIFYGRV